MESAVHMQRLVPMFPVLVILLGLNAGVATGDWDQYVGLIKNAAIFASAVAVVHLLVWRPGSFLEASLSEAVGLSFLITLGLFLIFGPIVILTTDQPF